MWSQIIVAIRGKEGAFYETKRKIARIYMQQVLPESTGLHEIITRGAESLTSFDVEDFGT